MNTLQIVFVLLRRGLMLDMRRRGDVLTVLFFFVIVASLFPLGVGPDTQLLRMMGGGVVWVSALLARPDSAPAHVAQAPGTRLVDH